MKVRKNLLIISPSKIGTTETFINAHIKQLDANVFYLYGWGLDFKTSEDLPLKALYRHKKNIIYRLKSLLPHFIYFRIRQRESANYSEDALIKRYIKDNNIDIILAEYGTAGSVIAPICKCLDIPLIVHFHGFDASRYDVLKSHREGYRFMFQIAKHILVVSNEMKKALINLGCPTDKLLLNIYGPHPDYSQITPDYNSNYIISVGRHTYKKAPYLTILAFQKVLKDYPDLKLIMIGTGELFDVSLNLVKSLGMQDNVLLLGALERPEIIRHLKSAFLFVQHSIVAQNGDSEGTPVGIIEAMSAGLPVVATRHAGIPDIVRNDEYGYLVDEHDIDAMAEDIIKLANDRIMARKIGQAGKIRIETAFTLEKHLGTINSLIYNSV